MLYYICKTGGPHQPEVKVILRSSQYETVKDFLPKYYEEDLIICVVGTGEILYSGIAKYLAPRFTKLHVVRTGHRRNVCGDKAFCLYVTKGIPGGDFHL